METTKYNYGQALLGRIKEEPNTAGGVTLVLDGAFKSNEVDYTDDENVKVMATCAINTANGLYSLIHENCNISKPLEESNTNIIMFISLAALASEIYFKAIIYYHNKHNGKCIKEHHLDKLYRVIPDEERMTISTIIPGIEEYLCNIANAYADLRYVFELNAFNNEYLVIFDLMDILHSITEEYETVDYPLLRYSSSIIRIE